MLRLSNCVLVVFWDSYAVSVLCVYRSVAVTESILSSWTECIRQCPRWCVCGTVKQTDVALCPCHLWVTAQSLSPRPPSFSVLSAAISASVRSTCLMVCVIHSDCFPTSNAFVLLVLCVCRERTGEWEPRWDLTMLDIELYLCLQNLVCNQACMPWWSSTVGISSSFSPSFHRRYSRPGNDFKVCCPCLTWVHVNFWLKRPQPTNLNNASCMFSQAIRVHKLSVVSSCWSFWTASKRVLLYLVGRHNSHSAELNGLRSFHTEHFSSRMLFNQESDFEDERKPLQRRYWFHSVVTARMYEARTFIVNKSG